MEHFRAEKGNRKWQSWVVRHSCGEAAGVFRYREYARGAAAAMNAIGETHDISTRDACTSPEIRALLLNARKEWDNRDRERCAALWRRANRRKAA
jgi:hypothetical protein